MGKRHAMLPLDDLEGQHRTLSVFVDISLDLYLSRVAHNEESGAGEPGRNQSERAEKFGTQLVIFEQSRHGAIREVESGRRIGKYHPHPRLAMEPQYPRMGRKYQRQKMVPIGFRKPSFGWVARTGRNNPIELGQVASGYHCLRSNAALFSHSMSLLLPTANSGRKLRRSKRLALSVPVQVYGRDVFGETFHEFTNMRSINAYGGLLALAARVQKGQIILIGNRNTREEQEFRVVHVGPARDGKWAVGIEFSNPAVNFWRIHFPALIPRRQPPGAN